MTAGAAGGARTISDAELHHVLLRHIVDRGYAPRVNELTHLLRASTDEVGQALRRLQDHHGVVLHPHTPEVWIIHPFSTAPTNFVLRTGERVWWGNCAWCALGAAALLDRDLVITTTLGADGRQVELHIRNRELEPSDYCVHFPVPMQRAWDNVIYTCSMMLLFESPAHVDRWCERHHLPRGDVQPLSTVWEFAKVWYGRHLSPTWTKWTADEAQAIFDRFGFAGEIWQLPASADRF